MSDLIETVHHAFLQGFGHTQEQIEHDKTRQLPNYQRSGEATVVAIQALAEAGYVIVPRQPTEAMIEAGWLAAPQYDDPATGPDGYWAAMVDAALSEGK